MAGMWNVNRVEERFGLIVNFASRNNARFVSVREFSAGGKIRESPARCLWGKFSETLSCVCVLMVSWWMMFVELFQDCWIWWILCIFEMIFYFSLLCNRNVSGLMCYIKMKNISMKIILLHNFLISRIVTHPMNRQVYLIKCTHPTFKPLIKKIGQ